MVPTNIAPSCEDKKVCIIIPVYNAERYLGYSLNSVLSQTYTNWTAILVDDGSTDSSLEICRSYEAIDSRFRVVSKPNGGVSSARNAGLALAEGDYLEFLDSDDCLAQDALEKQVALATAHNSQLVIANAVMVDFNNPCGNRITLNSNWLEQSPSVLSAEEFREKRMRLIWLTALLESPWAKLYDLALWKQLGILFPEDMSLGEDFVSNMKYYSACNKAVFLNECGYYYNQYVGSGSLSEKYRPDLFEIKMYLMDKLEEHLGGLDDLSEPELNAFYCYTAGNGLTCVEQTVLNSGMDGEQLSARMREMFAHPLFAKSIRCASYIPERFVACIPPENEDDLENVIQYIANDVYRKTQNQAAEQKQEAQNQNETLSQDEAENSLAVVPPPGLLNRAIRKLIRTVRPSLGQGKWGNRLTRWEQEIALYGLKRTAQSHIFERQSREERLDEYIDAKISKLSDHLDQQLDEYIDAKISEVSDHLDQRREDTSRLYAAKIQKNVNDYSWISEQRMTRYAYQRDINELRQRKKAIMLATAEHANIGDAAITLAEQQVLGEQFPEYFQVEISTYEFNQKEAFLHAILNTDDILFIHGGGNIGDLYLVEEELRRKIISEFPNNKIIILPQTICFSDTASGTLELKRSSKIYNSHKDLTLFVRGETSLEIAKKYFDKVNTFLMPDSVHALRSNYAFDRSGALLCLREDDEGTLSAGEKEQIACAASAVAGSIDRSTNIHIQDVTREIRGLVVRQELMRFAKHRVVITDRLHGMIFSAITGTPCVVLSSYNHKIREYYEAFFQDSNGVFFIGDDMSKLEAAINKAMQVTDAQYPVFERDMHSNFSTLCMEW